MKNTYKTSTNYFNTHNRNLPYNLKSYGKLKTEPAYYNKDMPKSINYLSLNEGFDNILSKALSKKKKRGILDISSPGNKDVLTDSDSEMASSKNTKNMESINKNMHKKNGCAKLIIEKVESQAPKRNAEYYKLTNQKKKIDNNDINYGNYRYSTNKIIRVNSPQNSLNTNSFNTFQYQKVNNNKNPMAQNRGYTNPKGFQKSNKVMDNSLNNRNYNLDSGYKKTNYKLTTESSMNKDSNYNYMNDRRNNLGTNPNSSLGQNNISYYKGNTPYLYKSTETSVDKSYNTLNTIGNKYSNHKRNNITQNEFSSPIPTYSNNDDSYGNKRSMGLRKNLAPNNRPQKTISLYNNYKDLIKRPTINQLINLNYNTKSSKTYLQAKFNEKLIKSVTKIQSFWRGAFIRELMTFVGKLNRFIDILYRIFQNNKKKNFFYFLNILRNFEKPKRKKIPVGVNVKGPSLRQKYIYNKEKNEIRNKSKNNEKYIKNNNKEVKKEEENNNYQNLLNDYNTLMDKYNKLLEEMNNKRNKFDNLDIEKNEIGINGQPIQKIKNDVKIIRKSKDKNEIKEKEEKKKNFDIIEPEQKDKFKIIPKSNNNSNSFRYRGRKQFKKPTEKIEKVSEIKYESKKENNNDNNKNIEYDDYLNHFKANIDIYNNEQFLIGEILNVKKTILNLIPFDISNNSLNFNKKKTKEQKKEKKEKKKENEKNKEEQQKDNKNIKEKNLSTPKTFDNISINKNKENELSIIIKKKEKKKKSKQKKQENKLTPELIQESQINLNTEIKGTENKKLKIFNECVVEEHNSINIIQNKKEKEFDKEQIVPTNDILLNITNGTKPKEENLNKIFNNESLTFNKNIDINIIRESKTTSGKENKNSEYKNRELFTEKIDDIQLLENENKEKEKKGKKGKKGKKEKKERKEKKEDIKFEDNNEQKKDEILSKENIEKDKEEKDKEEKDKKEKVKEEKDKEEKNKEEKVKEEKDNEKEKKFEEILMVENNNILYIKRKRKFKMDKMTEITEELNKIEPNNHYELIFKGQIDLNKNLENSQKIENEENTKLRNKNNKKNKKNKNKGKKEISNTQEEKITEKENKKNYNEENEVEKGDGIEINPIEFKKAPHNPNNVIISYENKIEVLYNKNSFSFTETAKKNMMKIILPIRLKTVLREHIRKQICPLLIKILQKK